MTATGGGNVGVYKLMVYEMKMFGFLDFEVKKEEGVFTLTLILTLALFLASRWRRVGQVSF